MIEQKKLHLSVISYHPFSCQLDVADIDYQQHRWWAQMLKGDLEARRAYVAARLSSEKAFLRLFCCFHAVKLANSKPDWIELRTPTFVIPSGTFITNVFDWQWLAKLFDTWDGRVELRGNLGCMESFTTPWLGWLILAFYCTAGYCSKWGSFTSITGTKQ